MGMSTTEVIQRLKEDSNKDLMREKSYPTLKILFFYTKCIKNFIFDTKTLLHISKLPGAYQKIIQVLKAQCTKFAHG